MDPESIKDAEQMKAYLMSLTPEERVEQGLRLAAFHAKRVNKLWDDAVAPLYAEQAAKDAIYQAQESNASAKKVSAPSGHALLRNLDKLDRASANDAPSMLAAQQLIARISGAAK